MFSHEGKQTRTLSACPQGASFYTLQPQCLANAENAIAASAVEAARNCGTPLAPEVRAFFEPRFGRNFADVRVHADDNSEKNADQLGARAYTVKNHILFNRGQFNTGTSSGRRLIAHELAHAIQQENGAAVPGVGAPGDELEREADVVANRVASSGSVFTRGAAPSTKRAASVAPSIQRDVEFDRSLYTSLGGGTSAGPLAEFTAGLNEYLAIEVVAGGTGGKPVFGKPTIVPGRVEQIMRKFATNYQKFLPSHPTEADRNENGIAHLKAIQLWVKVHTHVFEVLARDSVRFDALPDSDSTRGGLAHPATRRIELNVRDYTRMTPRTDSSSAPQTGSSAMPSHQGTALTFDGFWRLTHELLHVTEKIKDDNPRANAPAGDVEELLNPLRTGFGLPRRISYARKQGSDLYVDFENNISFKYPRR